MFFAEKKLRHSLKQLQQERVMWQVLSQEAELHVDTAANQVHQQKSNGRQIVQIQVNKAIEKEQQLKTFISNLRGIHSSLLLKVRKAKHAAIQASKQWKQLADKRMIKITELKEVTNEAKDELARVTHEMQSNLIMNEATSASSPSDLELKKVGRDGKWESWVIQYICELLVIGAPPKSIPGIISSSYQTSIIRTPPKFHTCIL